MPIPKGLLLYKAERHRESFPADIKYGHYSDKLFSSANNEQSLKSSNFVHRYQKKLVKEIFLKLYTNNPTGSQLFKILSKFNNIRKLTIRPDYFWPDGKESKDLMIKAFQKVFRILKRLRVLVLFPLGEVQESSRPFKNLLLLKNLKSLTFVHFLYYDVGKSTKGFMQILKRASKRKYWPKLRSLGINPFAPDFYFKKNETENTFIENLRKLSEFLQDLKSLDDVYKCVSMQIILLSKKKLDLKQAKKFWEIMKIARSITLIEVGNVKCYPKITHMMQYFQGLKCIFLNIDDELGRQKLDLRKLNNIRELTLSLRSNKEKDVPFYREALKQVPSLKSLWILSLEFYGRNALSEELKLALSIVIANLGDLKQLKLELNNDKNREDDGLGSGIWLKDVFQAIGKIVKLQKLFLSFASFEFEDPKGLLRALSQSLVKLTQISDLSLMMGDVDMVEEKELVLFWQSLRRLIGIENLSLKFSKDSLFKSNVFVKLMNCILKNFPSLSRLDLSLSQVIITQQGENLISRAIQDLKFLNEMVLNLEGELESGIDLGSLRDQMNQKFNGKIYFASK